MVIPATRDGKAYASPSFCFCGSGHLTKQSRFRGAFASAWAWAHTLQSSLILSLFSSPAAHCVLVYGYPSRDAMDTRDVMAGPV